MESDIIEWNLENPSQSQNADARAH
jgi:hypothetical protein